MNGGAPDPQRRAALARPGFYSPLLHLATTVGSGLAVMAASAALLRDVRWWELIFATLVAVVANACEWHLHRDVMHRRRAFAAALHHSHSEVHHQIYRPGDMAIRDARELRVVLLKAWVVPALAVALSPAALLLWRLGQRNLAALLWLVGCGYLLAYELLHLAFHLPAGAGLRGRCIRAAARHHTRHHDPRLRQRANFNVTIPLWDLLRGTRASDGGEDGA